MEIKYERVENVTAQISDKEARRIAIAVLRKVYDIPEGSFAEKDQLWIEWEEGAGSHSWFDKRVHRALNKDDDALIAVIKHLQNYKRIP